MSNHNQDEWSPPDPEKFIIKKIDKNLNPNHIAMKGLDDKCLHIVGNVKHFNEIFIFKYCPLCGKKLSEIKK